ncbi:MAG: hypothetical protein ACI33K_08020 [Clostridiaceae bacterium]
MDRFYLTFENTDTATTKSGISIPVDYSFWPKVIKYFTDRSTSFLVECWEDEKEAIRSASSYGEKKEDIASKLLTFEGRLTEEFINELINEPFDHEGKIKWFTLKLKQDGEYILCAAHYGSEFITGYLRADDKIFIEENLPKDFSLEVIYEE